MNSNSSDNIELVYNPVCIRNCGFKNKYFRNFRDILSQDYGSETFSFDSRVMGMRCIDLDDYEHSENKIQDSTMDCAISVSSFNSNTRKHSNHRVLLVEFKLDCTSKSQTVSETKLHKKETRSRDILNSFQISTDVNCIFIFSNNLKADYQRRLERWKKGSNGSWFQNWTMASPSEFNAIIKFEQDYPYSPVNLESDIKSYIKSSLNNGGESFIAAVEFWFNKASYYKKKFIVDEYKHIMSVLHGFVPTLVDQIDYDYREYIKSEDYFKKISTFSD